MENTGKPEGDMFDPYKDGPVTFIRKRKAKGTQPKYDAALRRKYVGKTIDDVQRSLNPNHRSIRDIKQG